MGKLSFAIEMVDGDKVLAQLQQIANLQKMIGGGVVSSGASRDVADMARQLASGAQATSKMRSELDKISSIGKGSGADFLKGALGSKTASFWELNPHLKSFLPESQAGVEVISKAKDDSADYAKWLEKAANEGERLAKALTSGVWNGGSITNTPSIVKGLREVTGRDLAKVQAMGDLNAYKGPPPPILDSTKIDWRKAGLGIGTALFNPWIGSRLLSDSGIGRSFAGGSGNGGSIARGIFGAGGAMGFGEFYIAISAVKKAFQELEKAMRMAIVEIVKAFQFAHQLYGHAISTGLPLEFSAQRSMTASVMGIGEEDVFRSPVAIQAMQQLAAASKTLAANAPQLAYTVAQWKILEFNMLALASKIAVDVTPAVNGLVKVFDFMLDSFDRHGKTLLKIGTAMASAALAIANPALGTMLNGAKTGTEILSIIGGTKGTFGAPNAMMKQLPASAWEKMGLIVGGGSGNTTNDLIRKSNQLLATIAKSVSKGADMPRSGNWNLDPLVANP